MSHRPQRWRGAVEPEIWFALLFLAARVHAISLTNSPSADTSLMEIAPINNNGGQAWVLSGRTQNGPRVRGLYRFDLTVLPTNALIRAATFQLNCIRQSSETMCVTNSAFGLHRLLRSWGEGTNVAITNPGQGTPATPGGATWLYAFYPTNAWAAPGGLVNVDFSAIESSFQFIAAPDMSPYRFESTPELVDDLQSWVRDPAANFGWILISNLEDTICSARRFNSREDTNSQPRLEIEFLVPPRFDLAQRSGEQFQMRFTPWPGQTYAVQFRDTLSNANWQTLTNLGLATNSAPILFNDALTAAQRYYRLSTY